MSSVAELKAQRDELDRQIWELEKAEIRKERWVKAYADVHIGNGEWCTPRIQVVDDDGDLEVCEWLKQPQLALVAVDYASLKPGDEVYVKHTVFANRGRGLAGDVEFLIQRVETAEYFVAAE